LAGHISYLRLRIIGRDDQSRSTIVFITGKYIDSSTGTGNV
jgi:hypothetical protein